METNRVVAAERKRLRPSIERLDSRDTRDSFRRTFNDVAGRFALGRIDGTEFREIVGELARNAAETATRQDRSASVARTSGTSANVPGNSPSARRKRAPWATRAADGSGRLTTVERVLFTVLAVAVAAVLVWIGVLAGTHGSGGNMGGAAPVAAVRNVPPADVAGDRERELIITGGYMAWQAYTECGNGPAACHSALRELNANPYGVTVMEDGSLIESAKDPNGVTVSLSELPSGDCWWEVRNDGTTEALCSGK